MSDHVKHDATPGPLGRLVRRGRRDGGRTSIAVSVVAALVVLTTGIAFAFWTSTGTGTASASTGTLNAPPNVAATSTPGSGTAHVSWDAPAGPLSPTGYYVTRISSSNVTSAACGTSTASPTGNLSCDDTSLAAGSYTYTVTAVFNSWTATSAPSEPVSVTTVGPAAKLAFTTQPSNSSGGASCGTQPVVTIQDACGNTVATDTSSVTLAITSGSGTAGAAL